jgi:hypothetical protein
VYKCIRIISQMYDEVDISSDMYRMRLNIVGSQMYDEVDTL